MSSSSSSTNCWGLAVHTLIWRNKGGQAIRPDPTATAHTFINTHPSLTIVTRGHASPGPRWSACTGWCSRWARAALSSRCSWTCCSPAACGRTQRCWTPNSRNPKPHLQKKKKKKKVKPIIPRRLKQSASTINKCLKPWYKQDDVNSAHRLNLQGHPLPLCSWLLFSHKWIFCYGILNKKTSLCFTLSNNLFQKHDLKSM